MRPASAMKRPSVLSVSALFAAAVEAAVAAPVTVYDATQLALGSYVVIHRIGVESWRSAFNIPGHVDEAAARNAVLAQAERVGADGVINLHCLGQTDRIFRPVGHYCYA